MIPLVGAALAATAAGLAVRPAAGARLPRRAARRPAVDLAAAVRHPRAALTVGALAGVLVGVAAGVAVGAAAGLVGWAVAAEVRGVLARRRRSAVRTAWVAALRGLAVALATGLALPDGLDRAARAAADTEVGAQLAAAASVARVGGDPVEDLGRRVQDGPGGRLAAALRLAVAVGAGPADLAETVAASVTADERAGRAADVAVAGAVATTRLLAGLPLAGIALAAAFGASAPGFLLGTPIGHGCLLAAAVLEVAGLRWSGRLVGAVR